MSNYPSTAGNGTIQAPNWVATDSTMSGQNLMTAYTVGANPNLALGVEPSGMVVQGADYSLGIGTFVYAQCSNAAGVSQGNVCEITQTLYASGLSISLVNSVQQWQGTANSGKNLCVALSTLAQNQFGWFQVYGNALVTVSGTLGAGSSAYWNANGVVQSAAVASKQMVSAVGLVAAAASFGQNSFGTTPTISAGYSIIQIANPHAQSAIT
jgi:hypothetical protein